jgi:hypothetical protein
VAQRKILLDTNSYLRLAKDIHPLLFEEFGPDACCLYVLKELEDELDASRRLQTKFEWASQLDYKENRSHRLTVSRKDRKAIDEAFTFIWDHIQAEQPGPSRVDAIHLAHAYVLGVPLVSDDRDLLAVAKTFDIQAMKSLDLLRLMMDCGHIKIDKVNSIVEYWRYWKDIPFDLDEDFERLFRSGPSS